MSKTLRMALEKAKERQEPQKAKDVAADWDRAAAMARRGEIGRAWKLMRDAEHELHQAGLTDGRSPAEVEWDLARKAMNREDAKAMARHLTKAARLLRQGKHAGKRGR